ncbi:hypothetical protein T4D_2803 [Trichinella pseudospiralis]|uniref:Uncharacterized protein n=1 Tax=Trichinella pseudospiralis TaxID=6337 RepID=A0A0V1FII0_TRIPS|nr:hypothetical protein T4D_2803 [Trichinella pseudospiralis]
MTFRIRQTLLNIYASFQIRVRSKVDEQVLISVLRFILCIASGARCGLRFNDKNKATHGF